MAFIALAPGLWPLIPGPWSLIPGPWSLAPSPRHSDEHNGEVGFFLLTLIKACSKTFIISIVFTFLSVTSKSQSYFFDNYSLEDGLAHSKIYSIIQDRNHLIWMGTPGGVTTYDGVKFQKYTSGNGLAESGVWSIYQDSKGLLWFGHLDGSISRWNGSKFENIPGGIIFKEVVYSFCENEKGELWITSYGSGAALISNPTAQLTKLKYENYKGKRLGDRVYGCFRLSDNKNYFITDAGIKVFNDNNKTFENFFIDGMPRFFPITTLFEDKNKNLWFGTMHGGLYRYNRKSGKFKIFDIRDGLSSNFITCIAEDRYGKIWVGTEAGITKIYGDNLTVYNQTNGFLGGMVICITIDAEDNILIGTFENGLSIYKGEFLIFSQPCNLPDQQIFSILEDSNKKIWFGTDDGIFLYDPSHKKNTHFEWIKGAIDKPAKIRFIKEDRQKNIWIGTYNNGLFEYFSKTGKLESNFDIFSTLPSTSKQITALDTDNNGSLWIGANDRLLNYNISTGHIHGYSQYDGLSGNIITAVHTDVKNIKYIGSQDRGITVFKDTLTPQSLKFPLLGNTTPTCITSDNSGNIWIGTEGQGVICFSNGKIKKRFQEKDGLISDLISFIALDKTGNIYAGTNQGLNVINSKTNLIATFSKRNGFIGIEAKNNAVFKDSKGFLWFGTAKGAIRFDPQITQYKPGEPFTHIRRFRVNYEDRPLKNGTILSYNENFIIFDYISVCLKDPEAVLYQVMLEGADKDWHPVTRQTMVTYSALPPNHYIFKLRAKNSSGAWNTNPVCFEFQILSAFYKTWWFISSCIGIILIAIYTYIKRRERNHIKEKQILEFRIEQRTKEVSHINYELSLKNKDITDSILYASRIQNALLPPKLPFDNSFVLFLPKDIVSGDFFWFTINGDKEWLAAVDCTGHGVPGAFMSIIGHNLLNKIVNELGIVKPSEILNHLNTEISNTLHQYHHDEEIHDGMDISLISYDNVTHIIEYSGAFNPLWIIRKNEIIETKANRYAIGIAPGLEKDFVNNVIPLQTGDTLYLFTDGYADQFGGTAGKKLKLSYFREVILSVQGITMEKQKKELEAFFNTWKGNNVQVDDILVIGRKFDF